MPPPTLIGDTTMRSASNHSSANTAPTMSMIESMRADFVQVHLLDRHAVNRGLGLGQPPEHR